MSKAISVGLGIASCAMALALGMALARIGGLEARELDAEGRPFPSGSSRLLEARLSRGDDVTFELCSADAMDPALWAGAGAISLVRTDIAETMFALPIDARLLEGARRSAAESCVSFGHVPSLEIDVGEIDVAIDLAWTSPLSVPVRARVLARRALGGNDLGLVLAALASALLVVGVLAVRAPSQAYDDAVRGPVRAILGLALVFGAGVALGLLTPGGPTWGLVGGLALAGVEIGAAFLLVRPTSGGGRAAALGLVRPERTVAAILWFAAAPVAGVALFVIARIALSLVPSTGVAPVETFVSWPSGMLSFAALAVVAPIAEEIFFRGLVYGALRGPGGARRELAAIGGSWLLFALFHVPQDWGNWGGLVSVLTAGLGFTLLRAATRSTLVPSVSHLVYNGLLASSALLAGAAT